MLETVTEKMRELGVDKFNFEMPYSVDAEDGRRLYATIELGAMPVPEGAAADERIQRIRDHNEQEKLSRDERRMFAASSRIGPVGQPRPDRRR